MIASFSTTPLPIELAIDHFVLARRLQQPRDADAGIDAQLQRIALVRLDAAQNQLDRLQTFQRLQVDAPCPHRQVRPFHDRIAEIATRETRARNSFDPVPVTRTTAR